MESHDDQIKRLAQELTELREFVTTTNEELDRWYEQAQKLKDDVVFGQGLSQFMPYFLWHYLSDADIRMKDTVYAEMQNERVDQLIGYLSRGVVPSEDEV